MNKKLCIAVNGTQNTGKSSILASVFCTPSKFERLPYLLEGVYRFYNKRVLLLPSSMEEQGKKIEEVLGEYAKLGLDYDALLIAVGMYYRKYNSTMQYLTQHFDVKLFALQDDNNFYCPPKGVDSKDYQFIPPEIAYAPNQSALEQKVKDTSDIIRNLLKKELHI